MKSNHHQAPRLTPSRGAFLLIGLSMLVSIACLLLRQSLTLTKSELLLLAILETIAAMLIPAFLGLFQVMQLRPEQIRVNRLEHGKMVYLFLLGIFLLFPETLMNNIIRMLFHRPGIEQAGNAGWEAGTFFPAFLLATVMKPAAASLFYDAYLVRAFSEKRRALKYGIPVMLASVQGIMNRGPGAVLAGILTVSCYVQSDSLLAPVLLLSGYGFGQVLLSRLMEIGLFAPGSFPGSMILLVCTYLAMVWLGKVYRIPPAEGEMHLLGNIRLSGKEKRLCLIAAGAVILAIVAAEVLQ